MVPKFGQEEARFEAGAWDILFVIPFNWWQTADNSRWQLSQTNFPRFQELIKSVNKKLCFCDLHLQQWDISFDPSPIDICMSSEINLSCKVLSCWFKQDLGQWIIFGRTRVKREYSTKQCRRVMPLQHWVPIFVMINVFWVSSGFIGSALVGPWFEHGQDLVPGLESWKSRYLLEQL